MNLLALDRAIIKHIHKHNVSRVVKPLREKMHEQYSADVAHTLYNNKIPPKGRYTMNASKRPKYDKNVWGCV